MSRLLIQGALVGGAPQDILIEGERIVRIAPSIEPIGGVTLLPAKGLIAVPGLANLHTHAAMTLFRGYGDDLPLMRWLEDYIWPVEAHMTEEDVYWGARLACLEMIKTGTTCFLDMYAFPMATARAIEDSGIRGVVSYTLFDQGNAERAALDRENCYLFYEQFKQFSPRVIFSIGPHAIYTVSGPQLRFCKEFAQEKNVLVHLHLSETQGEVGNAIAQYGLRPVHYLADQGALSDKFVLAHSLWMDDSELDTLAQYGAACVHNPASNMKLASGIHFRFDEMRRRGIPVGIGTDGCASSNNLDMYIAMRLGALLGKASQLNPEACKATDIYHAASEGGYQILGLDGGALREGALADLCLLKSQTPTMLPLHNLVSNLVYSADGSVVDTTIVAGKILMRNGYVEGEEEIMQRATAVAYDLLNKRNLNETSSWKREIIKKPQTT